MKRKYKIIISSIVVIVFITTIFLVYGINKKAKEVANRANTVDNESNTIPNDVNENTLNEIENDEIDNTNVNQEQNTDINTSVNNTEAEQEENKTEETNITNPEEKAIQLVKKDWGEDSTIKVTFEGIDNDGKYIVGIRDQETTYIKYWYYVDVQKETFTIKAN